jgi:hypothetical protein
MNSHATEHELHESPHEVHAFDPQPVAALAADEPHTPLWLPAVGLLFFTVAGVIWLVSASDDATPDAAAPLASAPLASAPLASAPLASAPLASGSPAVDAAFKTRAVAAAKRRAAAARVRAAGAPPGKPPAGPRIRKIERRPDGTKAPGGRGLTR